jgi:hypothetical protein
MKSIYTFLFVLLTGWAQGQTYTSGVVTLSNTSGLEMNVKIDLSTQVTLTVTGPANRWFSIGFNATTMTNGTDLFFSHKVAPLTTPDAYLTGFSAPVFDNTQNWIIVSDNTVGTVRTIVATRSLNTGDSRDYVFLAQEGNLNVIWARGSTNTFNANDHGSNHMGTIPIQFTSTLGINENENKNKINLYPNPVDQYVNVTVEESIIGKNYSIHNSNNVAIIKGVINHENMMISLTTLPMGLYIFTIDDVDRQSVKLIKK